MFYFLIRFYFQKYKKKFQFQISLFCFNRLGNGKFITQSLLILVEDINDNVPVFEPHTPSILVREHSSTPLQLTTLIAHDQDSGIYGQVIYSLESDQPEDLDLFSVSTVNNQAQLKLTGNFWVNILTIISVLKSLFFTV